MKWSLILLCICTWLTGCNAGSVRVESRALAKQPVHNPDRLIIVAVDNTPVRFLAAAGSSPRSYDSVIGYQASSEARRSMRAVEQQYGLDEVDAWPIEPLHMHCAVLQVPAGADRATMLATLAHDPRVTLAQPMHTFETRTDGYNDPYVGLQRGFQQMDVMGAHPLSLGDGIKVTIIDTGVDTHHPDLAGSIAAAANFVDDDEDRFRRDRHGTEMAGVIAAIANNHEGIVGIAPKARLTIYKACWQLSADVDAARCNSLTLARALTAAFNAHAQVINLSLVGPDDPLLGALIREGLRRGVLIVGAADSEARSGDGTFLNEPGVIEVASSSSVSANPLALHAPGREILTSLPGGHYDFASGDSLATAEVTGVVALLLAQRPELSASSAYEILRSTTVHSSAAPGDEHVDACAAVVSLVGHGSCVQKALAEQDLSHQPSQFTAVQ
jgi:subtilisin family serine protease